MTERRAFLSCALTGGMSVPGQNPAIPVTPEQIVASGLEAAAAGAAILHVHVRDDEGRPVSDLGRFREVVQGLREGCDAIVQPTTGGGVGMTIDQRAAVVSECRPEMATFNCGSINFGIFRVRARPEMAAWEREYLEGTRDYVFRNTFKDMEGLAAIFREAGTKPEFECYEPGHLHNLRHLVDEGLVEEPVHIQFVLGVLGATPATLHDLAHMHATAERLFGSFTFSAAGVGYPGEFHMAAGSLMLGGHIRVGLEDNLRTTRERRAGSNAELVERGLALVPLLDREPAGPAAAREILGL
jgi:uncharacterized protein (DUF849 family)